MSHFNPWQWLPADIKRQLPNILADKIEADCHGVKVLSDGLSNQNFHIALSDSDWVLRVNQDNAPWCERDNEVSSWRLVEAINRAPKLIWLSDDKRFYLSQFIPENNHLWSNYVAEFSFYDNKRPQQSVFAALDPVAHLLGLLTPLSKLPLPTKQITMTQQWQVYVNSLSDLGNSIADASVANKGDADETQALVTWQQLYRKLTSKYAQMAIWLEQLETCVISPQFCHRDLSPYNLLFDGKQLKCIDFEYCAASHPLFDLVAVVVTHQLTQEQVKQLTEKYLRHQLNLTHDCTDYLAEMAHCFWLFAAAWALMMAANQQLSPQQYFNLFNKYLSLVP
ncbi:hypothetical protein BCU94_14325 [Shewanella sp. 10N.286.52.C2]|uniref:phosphotransferase n=1 Tax=Shewanella sp. 10N.286.52.C2 TaxID=1880838 RepID=UPI000C85FEDA|nr:phosphotransferase [Shewanella sp. 10N.286.52.C2]PMG29270.1 hypothetical protein BCU94_14325 [Shewanella sp. 10N.286.52.C2]